MDLLLLETGGTDNLLLESGDAVLLEASAAEAAKPLDCLLTSPGIINGALVL